MNAFFAPIIRFLPRLLLVLCLPVAAVASDFFSESNNYFDPFMTEDSFNNAAQTPGFQDPNALPRERKPKIRPFPNLATDPVEHESILLDWQYNQDNKAIEFVNNTLGLQHRVETSQSILRPTLLYGKSTRSQIGIAFPFQLSQSTDYSGIVQKNATTTKTINEEATILGRDVKMGFKHEESSDSGLLGLDFYYNYQFGIFKSNDSAVSLNTSVGNPHYHSVSDSKSVAGQTNFSEYDREEEQDLPITVATTGSVSFETPFIYDRFYRLTYSLNYEVEPRFETVWNLFYTLYEANDFYDLGNEMGFGVNARYLWRKFRFIGHANYIQKQGYTRRYDAKEVEHGTFNVVQYGVNAIYPFQNSELSLQYQVDMIPKHESTDGSYEFVQNEDTRIGLSYRYYINLVSPSLLITEEVIENPTLDSLQNNYGY